MSAPLLSFEKVSLGYGSELVLRDVQLKVQPGELVVVAGPSGIGKSTLMKAAVGLLPPLSGRVRLFGEDISRCSETRLADLRSRVGLLFQGGALINSMTIAENLALPLENRSQLPSTVLDTLVHMKLAQVGLEESMHKTPPELSGGMRKRAALARALALDPELLLCDEPSAGLDPVTAAGLDRLLKELRAALHMTLVVVTHELSSIEAIADRVVMIADQQIVFDGSLEQAHKSELPPVRDFFGRRPLLPERQGASVLDRFMEPTSEVRS